MGKEEKFFQKKINTSRTKKSIKEFKKLGLIKEGTFIGNHKGFGFVELEEEEDDIFIPADATGTAMHQDKVQVLLKKGEQKGKRKEGSVIRILERANQEIVGTFQSKGIMDLSSVTIRNFPKTSMYLQRIPKEYGMETR